MSQTILDNCMHFSERDLPVKLFKKQLIIYIHIYFPINKTLQTLYPMKILLSLVPIDPVVLQKKIKKYKS